MTPSIPPTWKELEAAGYEWHSRTLCRGCGQEIEWWRTPSGRWMPIELVPEMGGQRMAHWGLCPKADEFRKQAIRSDAKTVEISKKQEPKDTQRKLFKS
jgi:hypothetical protein